MMNAYKNLETTKRQLLEQLQDGTFSLENFDDIKTIALESCVNDCLIEGLTIHKLNNNNTIFTGEPQITPKGLKYLYQPKPPINKMAMTSLIVSILAILIALGSGLDDIISNMEMVFEYLQKYLS